MAPEPPQSLNKGARIPFDRDAASVHFSRELDMNNQKISTSRYTEFDADQQSSYGRNSSNYGSRAGDSYLNSRGGRHQNYDVMPRGNSHDSDRGRYNDNRNDTEPFRSNMKPNPVRQPSLGLRARTEQLEIENSNRQRMAGKSGPQQRSSAAGQPTSSPPPRGADQNGPNGQSNPGYGAQSQSAYGGMGMGGGRYGGMGGGYGGYGGGMYGMGGMGMGMGMGMGSHMMMGPFSWIYSLNNIVHSIPMMMDVLGMNSQMLYHLYIETCSMLLKFVNIVKRSDFRRFLQQKSRRSQALRMIFILVSMGLASQAVRIAKLIAEYNFSQRRKLM